MKRVFLALLIGIFALILTHSALAAVPEPADLMLLGTGLICLAGAMRRKFSKA